jgi:hypothetical protein
MTMKRSQIISFKFIHTPLFPKSQWARDQISFHYGPPRAVDHSSHVLICDTDGYRHQVIAQSCQAEVYQGEDGSDFAAEAYNVASIGLTKL